MVLQNTKHTKSQTIKNQKFENEAKPRRIPLTSQIRGRVWDACTTWTSNFCKSVYLPLKFERR